MRKKFFRALRSREESLAPPTIKRLALEFGVSQRTASDLLKEFHAQMRTGMPMALR